MKEDTFEKYCLVIDEWFINGFNGTKAYQSVYPNASDESADSSFREMVGISRIDNYIKEKKEKAQLILLTSHEKLLQELKNWAYSDITETLMLSPDEVKKLPNEIRRLITKFKTTSKSYMVGDILTNETVVELWFVSKEKAMEMIHKHTGFYEEHNHQKSNKMSKQERQVRLAALKKKLGK